jgi:hypothetical protein
VSNIYKLNANDRMIMNDRKTVSIPGPIIERIDEIGRKLAQKRGVKGLSYPEILTSILNNCSLEGT